MESQVDDETPATHATRAKAVKERLNNTAALITAFNTRDLALLGRPAFVESDPEIEQHAMRAVITLVIGYRCA